jgi:hypothetical protein
VLIDIQDFMCYSYSNIGKDFPVQAWRPLGLREVEAPTFLDIRLIDGGKVVNPTSRLLFTPRKIPDTHLC